MLGFVLAEMLARRDRRAESVCWLDWVGGEACLECFDFEGSSLLMTGKEGAFGFGLCHCQGG